MGFAAAPAVPDPRHISNGWNIPSEGYADQPYIVKTDDGAWLCVMTTGAGDEGAGGQHVVSMRSTDRGRTWEKTVPIEPADGPEASYAVLLKVPYGRIYAFYNHNTDNVREVKREDKGVYKRVDSLGHYVFKYSDDHGRTWSAKRYDVPIREFECDRNNVYGGKLRFFWNVGRPLILGDAAIMVMHKVGAMGAGFFAQSEGAFFKSKNILTERDPEKLTFETLPDGDIGLRTPPGGGRVAEEQSIVKLSDGSLYCVYRTVDGWPACAYSRDGGHTWTPPAYKTYTPGGRRVKHPRAANFAWNCSNGKFLYWFHNHGGRFIGEAMPAAGDRVPTTTAIRPGSWPGASWTRRRARSSIGRSRRSCSTTTIRIIRMSYPDLVEDGGKFYVTETQKNIGRVHEIPKPLLDGPVQPVGQPQRRHRTAWCSNLPAGKPMPTEAPMPTLPEFNQRDTKRADHGGKDLRAGFSLDLWLQLDSLATARPSSTAATPAGKGILVSTTTPARSAITLNDGRRNASWDSDQGALKPGKLHHVVITVDGGPKIITFVVDGVLCDGGDERQFGWGRSARPCARQTAPRTLKIAPAVRALRIYNRAAAHQRSGGQFPGGSGSLMNSASR